jgi:hypothetical protein
MSAVGISAVPSIAPPVKRPLVEAPGLGLVLPRNDAAGHADGERVQPLPSMAAELSLPPIRTCARFGRRPNGSASIGLHSGGLCSPESDKVAGSPAARSVSVVAGPPLMASSVR